MLRHKVGIHVANTTTTHADASATHSQAITAGDNPNKHPSSPTFPRDNGCA